MMTPYHTALKRGSLADSEPFHGRAVVPGGVVLRWDILAAPSLDIPEDYGACDVLYSEIAWPAGAPVFDARAGVSPRPYGDYARAVEAIIMHLGAPAVIVCGKPTLRFFRHVDFTGSVLMNGEPCTLACWNGACPRGGDNVAVIRDLAETHERVGDFCCGYGLTGRLFRERGKEFVLSDYNARCVGYIMQASGSWGVAA